LIKRAREEIPGLFIIMKKIAAILATIATIVCPTEITMYASPIPA
jgi:hypothetical protein